MPRKKISKKGLRRSTCYSMNLPKKDLNYLLKNTRFDAEEITQFYRNFLFDCPDEKLGKAKVLNMYEMILPSAASAKLFVDQIFRIFDADNNGFISFMVRSTTRYIQNCSRKTQQFKDKLLFSNVHISMKKGVRRSQISRLFLIHYELSENNNKKIVFSQCFGVI